MRAIIAADNTRMNDQIAVKLISEGVEPYKTLTEDEMLTSLDEKSPEVLIIDFDSENFRSFDTIKEIKTRHNQVRIIIITIKHSMDFVRRTMELGVFGLVSKVETLDAQMSNLMQLIETMRSQQVEKRRHMRVQPRENETNTVSLKIPGLATIYKGITVDISLGGVACEMESDISDSVLFKGLTTQVDFILHTLEVSTSARVVLKKGKLVALHYRDLREAHRQKISEYVISHME